MQHKKFYGLTISLFLLGNLSFIRNAFSGGGIATDDTLGLPDRVISAPNSKTDVTIQQNDGKTVGRNLFHSFSKFNIESGQTVTFKETKDNSLDNVISRVTGGSRSYINGILESTRNGHADFYLINPSGVVFGKEASVNVPAAFHISTADEITFRGGGKFSASQPTSSQLSAASPSAFGFLATSIANNGLIKLEGASLSVKPGQDMDFTAGQIRLDGADISTTGGHIRMAAVKGGTNLNIDTDLLMPDSKPSEANSGNLAISNSSLSSSGNGGGGITFWGNKISIKESYISADNLGALHATAEEGIAIQANQLKLDTSLVSAFVGGGGDGGSVRVTAGDMSIDGGGNILGGFTTDTGGSGRSGNIVLEVRDRLSFTNGAAITASTFDEGHGGDIHLTAENIDIDAGGISSGIGSGTLGSGEAGKIVVEAEKNLNLKNGALIGTPSFLGVGGAGDIQMSANNITIDGGRENVPTGIESLTLNAKNAGNITIKAIGNLNIKNSGSIEALTLASGQAGNIEISSKNIVIEGEDSDIAASSFRFFPGSSKLGKAGNITIYASDNITIKDGGRIEAFTQGNEQGGQIQLTANNLNIDGGISRKASRITALTTSSGSAGTVAIKTNNHLNVTNGGLITTSTASDGSAGSVIINAGNMSISDDGLVSSDSKGSFSSGKTGKIDITVTDRLELSSGSIRIKNQADQLDTKTAAQIKPGRINIRAHDIALTDSNITSESLGKVKAGDINLKFTGSLSMAPSFITTNANEGSGGAISITGGELIRLQDSEITTSVRGVTGNGGNITIGANALVMETALIQANTAALGGSGGDINLNLKALLPSGNMLILGGSQPIVWQPGTFGLNVIQAAAPSGLSGQIQSTAPQLNLSGVLANLGSPQFDSGFLNQAYCSLGAGSSLVRVGKGGLPPKGRDAWVY